MWRVIKEIWFIRSSLKFFRDLATLSLIRRIFSTTREERFSKLLKNATEKAEAAGISILTVPHGQQRQRKVPAKYKHGSESTTEWRCTIHSMMFFLRNYIGFKGDGKTHAVSQFRVCILQKPPSLSSFWRMHLFSKYNLIQRYQFMLVARLMCRECGCS